MGVEVGIDVGLEVGVAIADELGEIAGVGAAALGTGNAILQATTSGAWTWTVTVL